MASFGRPEGEGTVIGTNVKLTGVLTDPLDIVVLGKVDGEVRSDHAVTVGPHAQVKGPVVAARVTVAGIVKGNVHTRDRLEILPKGNLLGNVETRDLVIHSGATFNGRCQMIGGEAKVVDEPEEAPPAQEPVPPRRAWPTLRLAQLGGKREEKESGEEKNKESTPKGAPTPKEHTAPKPPYEVEE
jgi:cytoskeletal protein CcmA (bactofilin family)